ncbi:hypothetical protein FACS18948_2970 [Clostridia bacterium]|nr:hypothetical protein FACS18948_2970 [Clostridia bacterium]
MKKAFALLTVIILVAIASVAYGVTVDVRSLSMDELKQLEQDIIGEMLRRTILGVSDSDYLVKNEAFYISDNVAYINIEVENISDKCLLFRSKSRIDFLDKDGKIAKNTYFQEASPASIFPGDTGYLLGWQIRASDLGIEGSTVSLAFDSIAAETTLPPYAPCLPSTSKIVDEEDGYSYKVSVFNDTDADREKVVIVCGIYDHNDSLIFIESPVVYEVALSSGSAVEFVVPLSARALIRMEEVGRVDYTVKAIVY